MTVQQRGGTRNEPAEPAIVHPGATTKCGRAFCRFGGGGFAVFAVGLAALTFVAGCPERRSGTPAVATSQPADNSRSPTTQPAADAQTQPAPPADPNHVRVRIGSLSDPQDGWLRIETLQPDAHGAWATGDFIPDNRIIIETEHVEQFSLDLSQIRINWDRRVILRIDGFASELTPKRRPLLHLRRSPAGSWDVVEPE